VPEPVPILFTIPNFITAQSGRAMLNIVERLDRRRFAPSICVLKKGGDLDKEVERLGIPLLEAPFTIPARPYTSLLWRARRAARPFREGGYKIWHSFHYLDDYTEAIIARMAGAWAWVYTKKNYNWGCRAWYLRTFFATRIVALNSDMLRDFFSSALFAHKVRLIPRGVSTDIFDPNTPPRLELRQRFHIPEDSILVGCVANLTPVKGQPTLIQAVAKTPGTHLFLAGNVHDHDYAIFLADLSRSLETQNRVHFLGGIKDVSGFLAEMDIFVLPTWGKWRMEGCPVALLEAMSSGRACIATDIPGSRDLIEHQKSGLLVQPESVENLTQALHRLVCSDETRKALGKGARERVLQNFSIENEAVAHMNAYEEIRQRHLG
jgi:glycosyltransferase involved in cell wall biosynthesis